MAVETLKKVAVQMDLENGRDEQGDMRYVKQSLQYVAKNGYNADKVLAVIAALAPCLSKEVGSVNAIKTSVVSAS